MFNKTLLIITICLTWITIPIFAEFEKGTRIDCKKPGRSSYSRGKVMWSNNRLVGVDFGNGYRKTVNKSRCRQKDNSQSTTTNNNNSNTNNNRRRPNRTTTNTGGVKTMFQYFAEANRRLRNHPSDSRLKMDRAVAGKYTRIEVGPRKSYSLILSHVQFRSNGTGEMLRETFVLTTRKQLVVDNRKNVRLSFKWGVERHKTSTGDPVTLIRMKFPDGGFRFYYALEPGKSMGSLFFDERTQKPGKQVLFAEQGQFIRDWRNQNHEIMRKALVRAHAVDQEIELRSLMNRNLQMGNNNMLMLNTMNMGFR